MGIRDWAQSRIPIKLLFFINFNLKIIINILINKLYVSYLKYNNQNYSILNLYIQQADLSKINI